MKKIIYKNYRTIELLFNGKYRGYNFYIFSLGTHPTAYIEIPKNHCFYGKSWNEININVHGGVTYARDHLLDIKNSWFIGWDYAHCDDYTGYEEMLDTSIRIHGKKWTTEQIYKHVKNAIQQLLKEKIEDE